MLYYTNIESAPLPKVILMSMSASFLSRLLDRFGATGSVICAVHCALTPLLLAAIPSLGLSAWLSHGFERGFVLFVTVLGLFSLLWGYRRHRAFRALTLLLVGLAILWAGAYVPALHQHVVVHAVVMTLGGTLVGLAHVVNLRLNHWHIHDASCAH